MIVEDLGGMVLVRVRADERLVLALLTEEVANATVDRLLHHAHLVVTGDSIRLTQATDGKGVTPLTTT